MERKSERNGPRSALAYTQLGLELAATVGLAGWAGHWAGETWGWAPWGLVGGLLAGAALGLTRFLVAAFRMSESEKEGKTEDRR